MTDHWFLIDRNAANLVEIRSDCFERNAIAGNNSVNMIERRSYSGDELLIGITGGNNQSWLDSLLWLNTPVTIWHGDAANEQIDQLLVAWRQAQLPSRDQDQDGQRDSAEQRRNWWQSVKNLLGI